MPNCRKCRTCELDLLGETVDGGLVHVELQSGNDPAMPLRMAEYCLGIFRVLGRFPRQVVLYVGEPKLSMNGELRGPDVVFRYRVIDIRMLDGDRLLESESVGDNIIAILAGLRDHKGAVRKIMGRIAGLAPAEREKALAQLFILAGLRHLGETVEQESRNMPIETSILEHDVLGPVFLKGRQEGELKGQRTLFRRLIESRFGALPEWADEKLATLSTSEIEGLVGRALVAKSVEELLK